MSCCTLDLDWFILVLVSFDLTLRYFSLVEHLCKIVQFCCNLVQRYYNLVQPLFTLICCYINLVGYYFTLAKGSFTFSNGIFILVKLSFILVYDNCKIVQTIYILGLNRFILNGSRFKVEPWNLFKLGACCTKYRLNINFAVESYIYQSCRFTI